MKIAITGGAGFIGTALAENLLREGHDVLLLDLHHSQKFPERSRIVDICDEAALTQALQGIEAVYHLAAEHRDDVQPVQKYYDVNVGGGQALLRACDANGITRVIFSSSVAVYGLNVGRAQGSHEDDTPAPFNDYGASKWQSERDFNTWADHDPARSLVIVRLVATFAPGNRGNIYTLMNQIARGKFIMIGSGNNRKSIAYLGNVAAFLQHALSFGAGKHLYNYADKPDLTTRELVAQVRGALGFPGSGPSAPYIAGLLGGMVFDAAAKITGRNFPISAIRVRKFCADTIVDAQRAHASGFAAPFTLQQGLQHMIAVEFLQTGLNRAA